MKFKYKAKNSKGEIQEGFVEALSLKAANEILVQNGLLVIEIKNFKERNFIIAFLLKYWEGVRPKEFVIFSRQLSVLIDAKVPILSALDSIALQLDNKFFALKIKAIISDIDGGLSFAEALEKHQDVFSKFYINMVRAGETSGNLQKNLNDLADNIEKNYELTSKLRGAMYYPAFIFSAMMVVGFLVMAFVMPKLLAILVESKATLPIQTKILIAISGFLANYWWAVMIVGIGLVIAFFYYIRTEDGKNEFDQLILKTPIIKTILNNIYVARFTENICTLLQSGLPITTSLMITSDVVGNEVYRRILREAMNEIKKGEGMAHVFKQYEIIPPVVAQMIKVGESTGRLDYTLKKITDFYMKEADRMVKNFSVLIEPVIMVVLAIGVGILVSAVLLPIYQVATSIK